MASLAGVEHVLIVLESVISNPSGTLVYDDCGGVAELADVIGLPPGTVNGKVLFGFTFWERDGFYC